MVVNINIKMESNPIEEPPEAIIPMEIVSSGGQSATTATTTRGRLARRAARRTESWYPQPPPPRRDTRHRTLPTYFASLPPQAEDIPAARKKRSLEEPLPTTRARTTDEAARKTTSPDLSLPPSDADGDIDDANTDADPWTDTEPNAVATARWTLEEDAELTSAVAKTPKKKWGNEYKIDWAAVAALVPGRTEVLCRCRWRDLFDPSIALEARRRGKWTAVEDSKLKDAVEMHGDQDWSGIAALVPGRTRKQCRRRWSDVLDPSIDRTPSGRTGTWVEDEDIKLKDAVQTHGGKDWAAISTLVPGRTTMQCYRRWNDVLDPSIDRTPPERVGKWTAGEDTKLKDAVQKHGGKDWAAISALVLGRTRSPCRSRWHDTSDSSINRAIGRKGKWTENEDSKLKDAVQTHSGKNWSTIAAHVPGRTRKQCLERWKCMDPHRRRVRGKKRRALHKTPALGKDPHSP